MTSIRRLLDIPRLCVSHGISCLYYASSRKSVVKRGTGSVPLVA